MKQLPAFAFISNELNHPKVITVQQQFDYNETTI